MSLHRLQWSYFSLTYTVARLNNTSCLMCRIITKMWKCVHAFVYAHVCMQCYCSARQFCQIEDQHTCIQDPKNHMTIYTSVDFPTSIVSGIDTANEINKEVRRSKHLQFGIILDIYYSTYVINVIHNKLLNNITDK